MSSLDVSKANQRSPGWHGQLDLPGTKGGGFMPVMCCDVPKQGQLPSKLPCGFTLLAAWLSPLGLCWGWELSRVSSLKIHAERSWPGPGEFPGNSKVVTLVMQDQESELHAARSILPVLARKAAPLRGKGNI